MVVIVVGGDGSITSFFGGSNVSLLGIGSKVSLVIGANAPPHIRGDGNGQSGGVPRPGWPGGGIGGSCFVRVRLQGTTVTDAPCATRATSACFTAGRSASGSRNMPTLRTRSSSLSPMAVIRPSRRVDGRLSVSLTDPNLNRIFFGPRSRTNDPSASAFEAAVAMRISNEAHRLRYCWLPPRSTRVGMRNNVVATGARDRANKRASEIFLPIISKFIPRISSGSPR